MSDKLGLGDRVRIDNAYWDAGVAGRTGTVAEFPEGATPQDGCVWVEFDVVQCKPGEMVGAEVDAISLSRIRAS